MWDDFNDNDFNEEDAEEFRNERDKMKNHPLRTKSLEIFELTHALVGSLDEARRELYGTLMMESAGLLGAKFSAAHGVNDYILKMENAVIMKVHARSLGSMTYQLALEGTHAEEHLQLLRDAIVEFKDLFRVWVKGFDATERYDDGWGLFLD
ncbi:hypothetical protein [Belliella aquatica]|uniref:Uncharacterized protein n=1 Tax=Belliella aquatica TaxID=1323734 RepID=A0ABQ1LR31_9BACT|nr:hypothetical protein [Belliella aquatica]MCH7404223.1 hypothetical protein [Belliella aquatica]GGC26329.1 hypothetical protein GCM10010993_01720 [Belliella aquatica]